MEVPIYTIICRKDARDAKKAQNKQEQLDECNRR